MGNSYFQFKQFTIQQDACAMKVCTDACLFGAWVASAMQTLQPKRVLDVGTGTGLLSLMLAQKSSAFIDAIEVETQAAQQASENFSTSPWSYRLQVFPIPLQEFVTELQYDLIVSNPPFFEGNLKSNQPKRNVALHSQKLTSTELLVSIKPLLAPGGSVALMVPADRSSHFEKLSLDSGFHLKEKVNVRQTDQHHFFRSMLLFATSTVQVQVQESEHSIKENNQYTDFFKYLLKDYYLYL